ncbi:hypothetical protein GCM10028791_30940 [Echinicola sediminis]
MVITLFASESEAQTSIGIRGGYSYSGMSYRPIPSIPDRKVHGIKQEPVLAFVVEHFFKDHAGVELNVQYLTTGYIEYNEEETLSNETHFNYLKIPFLSNFYFGRSGRFHIKMGPHFGRLVKATDVRREFEAENPAVPILPTYGQADDKPNRLMYGLTAGAGISKVFGKSTLAAEVRASYELGRVEGQERIFDMAGTNLEFTVSYLFQVIKRK